MFYFDPMMLLFISPAILLALIAQVMVKGAYAQAQQIGASMSGYAAARRILDSAGLYDVGIEQVHGYLSDHYDPRDKVLRLSDEVYHGHSMASVGIAAHEAGHALQDAHNYAPLLIRNAAVPVANFGGSFGMLMILIGIAVWLPLAWVGVILFGGVALFQLVNLPVEFDASSRAKAALVDQGIIDSQELPYVRKVLNAAALTYVAATLQSVLTLLYYVLRLMAYSQQREER